MLFRTKQCNFGRIHFALHYISYLVSGCPARDLPVGSGHPHCQKAVLRATMAGMGTGDSSQASNGRMTGGHVPPSPANSRASFCPIRSSAPIAICVCRDRFSVDCWHPPSPRMLLAASFWLTGRLLVGSVPSLVFWPLGDTRRTFYECALLAGAPVRDLWFRCPTRKSLPLTRPLRYCPHRWSIRLARIHFEICKKRIFSCILHF